MDLGNPFYQAYKGCMSSIRRRALSFIPACENYMPSYQHGCQIATQSLSFIAVVVPKMCLYQFPAMFMIAGITPHVASLHWSNLQLCVHSHVNLATSLLY
jgi:hypothetical protein